MLAWLTAFMGCVRCNTFAFLYYTHGNVTDTKDFYSLNQGEGKMTKHQRQTAKAKAAALDITLIMMKALLVVTAIALLIRV